MEFYFSIQQTRFFLHYYAWRYQISYRYLLYAMLAVWIMFQVENESLRKELAEKQELLTQAAKAIELIEEQKQVSARNQAQYQQTLEQEHERADKLEKGELIALIRIYSF